MPIYEYECAKCGEVFERIQKHSDPPPKSHSCGSRKVRRIMSKTSFRLKGDGWYATDYGPNSKKSDESKEQPAAKEETKKSPKKEDSKKSSSAKSGANGNADAA